jgi:hypothetical protein
MKYQGRTITLEEAEAVLEAASVEARSKQDAVDADHLARHGNDYIWVERRVGYRGRRVCRVCYQSGPC